MDKCTNNCTDKCTAIVLSAGKGTRMGTDVAKQYLPLGGRPVLYYCLKAFQDSFIDEIVIVAAREDHEYIRHEIVDKYGIGKVTRMVEGGAQRYDSVLCGLRAVGDPDFVFIHDGARPFINEEILKRAYDTVKKYGTAIVSVPSKDTVKIVDGDGITLDTPDRNTVRLMQTPQVFAFEPILKAYEKMDDKMNGAAGEKPAVTITDDAMVMEMFGDLPVHVSEGSYRNIKITTPEDMLIAEAFI
ncbi:MAG: 2-C-methyl-D-erythritol 4-phosphate cytidylyltransferase [Lachnospiraceae bacterium]|nr:2-C-methyl-D-erythritol 4-phosphate cytidylyltransferase [Lachnospiraceae bacterium]